MATLSYRGVQKRFGDVVALAGLDLDVREGELLVLVGPSGCGKTTALRVAAGLEPVSAGSIVIGGRDVTGLAPGERNVSMVFQSYAVFPHLNVAQNIGIGLAIRRVPKAEVDRRVREAAALVGCDPHLERMPSQLSGGERQRVALARALVRHPDVFLLDEPLSNLDAQLRVHMRAELERLHQDVGATMVYVTHDQVEALTLGDRVAVLDAGELQQVASPDDIYRRPANRFVATFIGSPSMNVLPAELTADTLTAGPFQVRFTSAPRDAIRSSALEIGIRPEHIEVGPAGGIPAEVQVVEPAGSDTFVHVSADGHRLIVRGGPHLRPALGSTVPVTIPPDLVYIFDARTGATLRHARWPAA